MNLPCRVCHQYPATIDRSYLKRKKTYCSQECKLKDATFTNFISGLALLMLIVTSFYLQDVPVFIPNWTVSRLITIPISAVLMAYYLFQAFKGLRIKIPK